MAITLQDRLAAKKNDRLFGIISQRLSLFSGDVPELLVITTLYA